MISVFASPDRDACTRSFVVKFTVFQLLEVTPEAYKKAFQISSLRTYCGILGGETKSISTGIERRRLLAGVGMITGRLEVRRQLV